MSSRHRTRQLLSDPRIWRAGRAAAATCPALSTGHAALDAALAGGWPLGTLVEVLVDDWGTGEFRLVAPALGRLSHAEAEGGRARWILFAEPPYLPYAPGLQHAGIDVQRILVARCRRAVDVFWTLEQALRSGACAAVAGWCGTADTRRLRRLQLAAESGQALALLFRPRRYRHQRSPAPLRLELAAGDGDVLSIDVFKRRGGGPCRLDVAA